MKSRNLTFFLALLFSSSAFSQEGIKNIKVEIEYYPVNERSAEFFKAAEDSYQVSLFSGRSKVFDLNFRMRMEDELTSEENYRFLSEVSFFDLQLDHRLGPFAVTWSVVNLLNWNNPEFEIEGYLEGDDKSSERVNFAHEADFLLSTAISYRF